MAFPLIGKPWMPGGSTYQEGAESGVLTGWTRAKDGRWFGCGETRRVTVDRWSRAVASDLQALAGVVRRLIVAPPGDEREAEFDSMEHDLALLSADEQMEVRRLAGLCS